MSTRDLDDPRHRLMLGTWEQELLIEVTALTTSADLNHEPWTSLKCQMRRMPSPQTVYTLQKLLL